MKYLVNTKTKEHKVATPLAESIIKGYRDFKDDWQLVEADDEGWIQWSGGECPLPYDCKVAIIIDERIYDQDRAGDWDWRDDSLTAYRPLLETAEKEEARRHGRTIAYIPETTASVFDRLKSAIAASESIPGIIAEIDALLPDGYCVAKRDVQPAEDMSDWRNWRKGDFVRAISTSDGDEYVEGMVYKIKRFDHDIIYTERDELQSDKNGWGARFFRFHSRPAKVAK